MQQKTIQNKISFEGVGIHSGKKVKMELHPSNEPGIKFIRKDIHDKNNIIKAHYSNISSSQLCSCLSNTDGVLIMTCEHLLAVLYLKGIFNLNIYIDSEELPILDGSGMSFLFGIESAGIKELDYTQKKIFIKKEITLNSEKFHFKLTPNDKNSLSVKYSTKNFFLNKDSISFYEFDLKKNLITDIIRARTFCDKGDTEKIIKLGLGKGGHFNNSLIIDYKNKIVCSDEKLRYEDETIRHKVFDFIGDICLLGIPIIAKVECFESGHSSNKELMTLIMSDPENYIIDR